MPVVRCPLSDFRIHENLVLEYPEAVRACAMRRYPRNLGTIPNSYCFLSFFGL